jgi:hypothetical protein
MTDISQIEAQGQWLKFGFRKSRMSALVPVRISREALEVHFGATADSVSLVLAYTENRQAIDAKVQAKMKPGTSYSLAQPLELRTDDF